MQRNSTTGGQRKPLDSPKGGRRKWLRLARNLALVAAVYLVLSQTWPRKRGLEGVSYQAWTRELAARQGSVVVAPVWASWCRNCIEIMPDLVQISNKYSEKGVAFVPLCLDDHTQPDDVAAAENIVVTSGADFPHFLLQQDIATSLGALSLQDLPAVLVYDPAGELRYKLEGDPGSNEISLADVEDAIESLLAVEGGPAEVSTTDEHR